jgi:hypothetical protein
MTKSAKEFKKKFESKLKHYNDKCMYNFDFDFDFDYNVDVQFHDKQDYNGNRDKLYDKKKNYYKWTKKNKQTPDTIEQDKKNSHGQNHKQKQLKTRYH